MIRRASIAAVALLASCAPAATHVAVREVPLPARFEGGSAGPSAGQLDWRAFFADESLSALIGQALDDNFDVKIALQRIEVARADIQRASGQRLPKLSAVATGAIRKYGTYTMDGAGNAATDITPGRRVPEHLPDLFAGVQATWEADLWKRLASLSGSAKARYLATIEGTNLVITNLVAAIAIAYYELVALDRIEAVLAQTLARQEQALEIMRLEKQAGRTNELAVQQFAAQLAGTRALSAATQQQKRILENQLNLAIGRVPQPIARTAGALDRELVVTAGVPSDLLRNRPDIRQAEHAVAASKFDVAAARAAFYPRLTISASLGYQAFDPRFLVTTPESIAYGLVGSLVAPLVNRRGIQAAFAAAKATQLQAMYGYQRAVLTAFIEVATELYTLEQSAQIVTHQRRKREAAAQTVDIADALFRAAKATYLDVLLSQQATLDAELELIRAQRDQHLARIRLYRALGGGWRGTLSVGG